MQTAETFLMLSQNVDGGWGYALQQASGVEATGAAVLALRGTPSMADAYKGGLAWLAAVQHNDGGWGMAGNDRQSGWQTAWAVIALARSGVTGEPLQQALDWLSNVDVLTYTDDDMQRTASQLLSIDASLYGWPWLPGEASWVEPTALTLLAFQAAPGHRVNTARANDAVRYLLNRRCRDGGWNVGNPVMFNSPLPARAVPTAWVLLALALAAPDAVTSDDLAALEMDMRQDGGSLALAWGSLALQALGRSPAGPLAQLAALQDSDGSWNANPYHTAVALLARQGRF